MKKSKIKLIQTCILLLILSMANAASGDGDKAVTFPPNDMCENATKLGNVTNLPFNTTDASFDGRGSCMVSPNIWYCYTAPYTGDVIVSLAGSSYDTKLAVYRGCECFTNQTDLIVCNDDFGGTRQSRVEFSATMGEKYLIEVGGFGSEVGSGFITIRCEGEVEEAVEEEVVVEEEIDEEVVKEEVVEEEVVMEEVIEEEAVEEEVVEEEIDEEVVEEEEVEEVIEDQAVTFPINNKCANATQVGDVINLPFNTAHASFDGSGLCMVSPNIWYCYTAPCTGDVTVSLLGSTYDTMLAVYDEWECYPAVDNLIECNDDFGDILQSQLTFAATSGNEYLIEIGGYASQSGFGFLSITCEGLVVQEKPDLGDAPDRTNNSGKKMHAYTSPWIVANYPTVYDDGTGIGPFGPIHLNNPLIAHLGTGITSETEADIGLDEDIINNIDFITNSPNHDEGDDGVVIPLTLPKDDWATIDYEVTVIEPNNNFWVNVWLDFNRDGDWDDTLDCPAGLAKEWAVQNQYLFNLPEGQTTITTPAFLSAHPDDSHEHIWMRITLSDQPWTGGCNPGEQGNAGSGPQVMYEFGETEDYFFIPETAGDEKCPLCKDMNDDGVVNIHDLIVYIDQWLSICQY